MPLLGVASYRLLALAEQEGDLLNVQHSAASFLVSSIYFASFRHYILDKPIVKEDNDAIKRRFPWRPNCPNPTSKTPTRPASTLSASSGRTARYARIAAL